MEAQEAIEVSRSAPDGDGYYMWTPNDPDNEVGARPVEIYRGELYALDTAAKRNKAWCVDNGTFAPIIVATPEFVAALAIIFDHAEGYYQQMEWGVLRPKEYELIRNTLMVLGALPQKIEGHP